MVLQGVMLLWFIEVAVSVVFVAVDIRTTPESPVMKWGFVIVTLYTGPIGAFLYVLACREPLPGTHAQYVRPRWRQVVGSTMHCVAGDGIGILFAAGLFSALGAPDWLEMLAEYAFGFLFGWLVFQALFMRDMAGGSYPKSLRMTFLPEFVSMNGVMAGMLALSMPWRRALGDTATVAHPAFWFVMSLALTLGFVVAYPLNWWLVSAGLKHGMITVPSPIGGTTEATPKVAAATSESDKGMSGDMDMDMDDMEMPAPATARTKVWMVLVSLVVLAAGVWIAVQLGGSPAG
jgi:hypothetical protein